ncbi:MAG: hypothetical protein C5B60_06510 [Chloroflexi bacterium]|nr:MAG: hypothetical protein C5B60_06510 [Chloroflexota bacterium]
MAAIKISVINASSVVNEADAKRTVAALQKQVHEDFYPVWGIDADLTYMPAKSKPPAGSWWLVILDDSDQAGALGYHDLTQEGLPLGKVFAKSDKEVGDKWSVTASHELLEMLADPDINLTALVENSETKGRLYAYEVCDACEADNDGYDIDGVRVSNFVYPAWFESFRKQGSTQFDHGKQIDAPFKLRPGGYIGVFDIKSGTGWAQIYGSKAMTYRMRPRVGSRRERRKIERDHWLPSTPQTAAVIREAMAGSAK